MKQPKRIRANAFDLDRADEDSPTPLNALLKPRPVAVVTEPTPELATVPDVPSEEPASKLSAVPAAPPVMDKPRGRGGRPAKAAVAPKSRFKSVPARVPQELYLEVEPLVKGPARPSWGQLVAATCQERLEEVLDAVVVQVRPVVGLVPRGQNKQAKAGPQVTARLNAAEQAAFFAAVDAAEKRVAGEGLDVAVTRTNVLIAALEVASKVQHSA